MHFSCLIGSAVHHDERKSGSSSGAVESGKDGRMEASDDEMVALSVANRKMLLGAE